jgi:pyruvate dehydrogenase E2 component (dihydrolipoamide acetyltransferase)
MPIPILMPALSPSMTEGNVARWLKQEGDAVKKGDALAEIESDKATIELEAPDAGTLGKILVVGGTQAVKVSQPIAVLLKDGEDAGAIPAGAGSSVPPHPAASVRESASTGIAKAGAAALPIPGHGGDRIFASPLARRNAKLAGVELVGLIGSGPHGRILRADVERAIGHGAKRTAVAVPSSVPVAVAAALPAAGPAYTEVPLSAMRAVIARRLTEASQTIPHFYLAVDCQVDKLLALRRELNGRSDEYKLSVNDFVIRAVALALRKVPAANASFTETAIRFYRDVDVSIAVATPDGLITPIIKHADQKGLAGIAGESKALIAKARDGKLKPEEFQGGTFTISNLGMYDVREFAAIINPPQGCILAVGAAEQRPVVRDGALTIATAMSCTLSVDHRVVDGAVGAAFLAAFKALIEEPITMLL